MNDRFIHVKNVIKNEGSSIVRDRSKQRHERCDILCHRCLPASLETNQPSNRSREKLHAERLHSEVWAKQSTLQSERGKNHGK